MHADKDGSGTIDLEELKECFRQLKVSFSDEEVKAFHQESDMDASKGVDFKEFIVVLALVYLLGRSNAGTSVSFQVAKSFRLFPTIIPLCRQQQHHELT